jgi:hypothetical protein
MFMEIDMKEREEVKGEGCPRARKEAIGRLERHRPFLAHERDHGSRWDIR